MASSKRSVESHSDQTVRQRLLARATELFARKGYASTTVREIVEAAGVTKPALYYYFRNKEGLYLELMQEAWKRFDTILDGVPNESGTIKERIIHLLDQILGLVLDQIEVARIGYSIYYGPPQGTPFFDFDAFHLKFQEGIRNLIEEGIQKKELRKGEGLDMTWTLIGAVNLAIELQICHPEMGVGREGLARIVKLIFEGIADQEIEKKGDLG
jgi:TetR/AcrR family transcriptional regulator